jgi:tetratricopeptide (TPR) repeat protein
VIGALLTLLTALAAPRDTTPIKAIIARIPLDTAQVVVFRAVAHPDTVYVGQQADYLLAVYADESVRERLRRKTALPPELRGLMQYMPEATFSAFPVRVVGRRRYEAEVKLYRVFPLAAGRYVIPPARLEYAMPLSYSFFSREESYELRGDSTVLVAIEPPAPGRPPDFAGAVGFVHVDARFDTTAARVGDPIHFTLRVTGTGNVRLFPRPALAPSWATAIPGAERVTEFDDSVTVRGYKEFDWVLTPTAPGRQQLPAVRYPFFDPVRRAYDVALTQPVGITVVPGSLAVVDSAGSAGAPPALELRMTYRGEIPLPLYRRPWFELAMALMPLPAIALAVRARPPRKKRKRRVPPDHVLRDLARQGHADLRPLRRAFLDAVAERLRAPASALAEPDALRQAARRAGTSGATAAAAAAFMRELNAAAFAAERSTVTDAGDRALSLYRAIDAEARRWRTPAVASVIVAGMLGASLAASALAPDADTARFTAGVTDYAARRYVEAARAFAEIVHHAPRAEDAWANLGTAALAAGDTARAVAAWQRALRIDPLAADVRERLDMFSPAAASAPGAVPPFPPLPIILIASALWVLSWLAIARRIRRRLGAAAPLPVTALAAAILLGLAGGYLDARLSPAGLAVARRDAPLRILPALGAERGSVVHSGETARVITRDGPWARIRVDRDRDGWVPGDALLPIDRD